MVFVFRRLAMYFAPSAPSLLPRRLQTRIESMRQRVLTAGIEGWGGVLKGGEGLVLLKTLREMLGRFCVESI